MLPKVNRIPKQELRVVVARGTRVESGDFTLRYTKTNEVARVAIIVSSKVAKHATQRNRIRRIIHQSIQNILPRIVPTDIVFIVRKNIATQKQEYIEHVVEATLKQERLI